MEQQRALDIGHAVVLLANFQQPGFSAGVLDVAGGHGEVLGVDEGGQRVDIQLLGHIGAGEGFLLGRLILGVGLVVLGLVVVQHLTGFGKLHVRGELLAGIAAQRLGERVHQLGHIVHGLDGIFQRFIDGAHALLHFQVARQISGGAAVGTRFQVQAVLQLLQGNGELIGDIAQLADDGNEGVNVPHSRLVELVHHMLQAIAHLDQRLLDLRLVDHGDQLVHTVQQGLRLIPDGGHGGTHLGAHLGHHGIGDHVAVVFQLFFVLLAAGFDLGLGGFQLLMGRRQLDVDGLQQLLVDDVDLGLAQLHLHHLLDEAVGRDAGHAAPALHIGHQRAADEIGEVVDITAFAADGNRHKGIHVHAVFNDGRGQAAAWQAGHRLVHLVGHLDHGAVHIGALGELHQQQAVVFRRGGGDGVHTRHGTQGVFHHVGDFTLHTLRAGTGVNRDHHQVRRADVRQQVGLHVAEGHEPQQQDHDNTNQHRKRFFDTEFFHFFLPFLLGPQAAGLKFPLVSLLYTRGRGLQ